MTATIGPSSVSIGSIEGIDGNGGAALSSDRMRIQPGAQRRQWGFE